MNKNTHVQAREMLKSAHLYCTIPRLAILEVFFSSDSPLTQDQIRRALPSKLDKVTVYRTLTSLLQADLVHRAYVDERAAYYELAIHCGPSQCHPHFTCTHCGQTHCLLDLRIPLAQSPHRGFKILRQQVRLEGICPDCN